MLERDNAAETAVRNSTQAAYLDRLVSRTEIATRASNMDIPYLQALASKWFWDKETGVYAWGPLHNLSTRSHYNRPYKRATLGEFSIIRYKQDY